MLRENEDVFQVFNRKAPKLNFFANEGFVDTMTNFVFSDLT